MKDSIRKIIREETEEYNTLCLPYVGADTDPITGDIGDSRDGGSRTHSGIDLTVDSGTELISPADGKIEIADFIESGGKCGGKIKINHTGTFISPYTGEEVKLKTVYCHLSEVSVATGDSVKKGQTIGKTGGAASKIDGSRKQKNANGEIIDADNAARVSSEYYREAGAGNSTAAHLHYEIYEDGSYVSPKIYVRGGGDFDYKPCETLSTLGKDEMSVLLDLIDTNKEEDVKNGEDDDLGYDTERHPIIKVDKVSDLPLPNTVPNTFVFVGEDIYKKNKRGDKWIKLPKDDSDIFD
tara:strand:- start:2018 stop:2905 length:888 start_codon:yes stop_codon:yes gene_type:complete